MKKGAKGLAILAPCFRKVEQFKEPDNKNEYHDEQGEKEVKRVISGFRVTYVFDMANMQRVMAMRFRILSLKWQRSVRWWMQH